MIDEADLKLVTDRKPGRPRKAQGETLKMKGRREKAAKKG
jgi:hypothetical protein